MLDLSGQTQATLIEARKVAPLKAEILFRQGQNRIRLLIGVDARSGDLLIEQEGTSDTAGVYGIQWGLWKSKCQEPEPYPSSRRWTSH